MNCPRCRGVLKQESYEGVVVARCGSCGGYWIPGQGLATIAEVRERTFSAAELEAYRRLSEQANQLVNQSDATIACPECQSTMRTNRYPLAAEVLVDRCPAGHGVWLDAGELEHIQIAVEKSQDDMVMKVFEKDLQVDDFERQRLESEREKYAFNPRDALLWFFA